MATVETIDFDQVFNDIVERLKTDETRRLAKPLVRLWDGDWNFRGEVYNEIEASFQVISNETGKGTIVLPASYYLSRWMTDVDARAGHKNIFITVDYQGTRWSGALDELRQEKDETGYRTVTATFLHDYEHLKHIIAYSNPFLPPEIQFPRLWIMFGPAKWALKLTLLVNLMRLENNMWTLPDDPLKPDNPSWFDLTMSQWSQAVTPLTFEDDHSVFAIVHSRFKNMHDASKKIVADAQLTWEPRRYLDGDPPPWPGANLRHGCLVWDLVDHSGWDEETSFGGNIFTGLIRAFTTIGSDGMTEGIDVINDPTFPAEYSQPGYLGTIPRAPGIILRDGKRTGVQTNSFKYQPASDVGVVTGGHSMPGVNELISASIQMAGDLIAAMIGIPPVGGAADAILKPLYTDTILAFMKWKDIGRAQDLGWSHFHETWGEGADRAYTLAALIALRTGMWRTRERTSHTVTVADGCEGLRIGQNGRGNCWLGTRIGTTVKDWGKPGRVYVDRVSELVLSYSRKDSPAFKITIGQRPDEDPILKGLEMIQEIFSIAQELGVL
ncbi:phage tail protein [Nocardia cyriacigeorgica]|uniref:Gp37-like protein n=1 Tax=Nocardia cyriacigeorgica TaxID=135487 RepID=UPI001894008D|nr:phage tail protein [Nocardia cyriacigeorgica]MBF6428686.1 phage tail protein [Nocardia cyriacigeorgica]